MDRNLLLDVARQMRKLADAIETLTKEENENQGSGKENTISLEDVRAVLARLSQHGKTVEVKELITKYGGTKLSDIDKENFGALLKDAEGIKIE